MSLSLDMVIEKIKSHMRSTSRLDYGTPQAGVLIPLFEREENAHVLLTQRAASMRKHSGQISFPGGKVEDGDANIVETALRETHEEVGIENHEIEIVTKFHDFETPYYSCITPVVGTFSYPQQYEMQESEIATILEVPIPDLLNPSIHHTEQREYRGNIYTLHFYDWENKDTTYQIWGATAGVLTKILDLIR